MKKLLLFFLIMTTEKELFSELNAGDCQAIVNTFSWESLTPVEWVNNYYLKVADSSDRSNLKVLLQRLCTLTKKELQEYNQLLMKCKENEELDLQAKIEQFGALLIAQINSDGKIQSANTLEGLLASLNFSRIFFSPFPYQRDLWVQEDDAFNVMPEILAFYAVLVQRTEECLKLIPN